MSPKELLYIEDALNHCMHVQKKCTESSQKLQDTELKNFVSGMATKNEQLFKSLYGLI